MSPHNQQVSTSNNEHHKYNNNNNNQNNNNKNNNNNQNNNMNLKLEEKEDHRRRSSTGSESSTESQSDTDSASSADSLPQAELHNKDRRKVAAFGTVLGVTDGGVEVYSCDYQTARKSEYPDRDAYQMFQDGLFTGYKWQCVELARRYLLVNQGELTIVYFGYCFILTFTMVLTN